MITIDTEKSTPTDIHFIIKIENPLIENGDKEMEFVNNQDNINECLDLFIRKYSPFSGRKEYSDELVRLNLLANEFDFRTELMKFDEKTISLRFNSVCVSNFENIVNEQYRIWRKINDKHCNENCKFIAKCNSTLMTWYQCNGQKNFPKVELGDECTAYIEVGTKCCIKCGKPIEACTCYNYSREQIIALINENNELKYQNEKLDKDLQLTLEENKRLKLQIEKMKNCFNCRKCTDDEIELDCENMSLWELK